MTNENANTTGTAEPAHVQVLTAEVRTLVVGSRQVTMSVYGQLDAVDYEQIEPFGRIRPKDARLDYIYLVGRHRESGALVRSSVPGGEESIKRELDWIEFANNLAEQERRLRNLLAQSKRHEQFEEMSHHLGDNHRCEADQIEATRDAIEDAGPRPARSIASTRNWQYP